MYPERSGIDSAARIESIRPGDLQKTASTDLVYADKVYRMYCYFREEDVTNGLLERPTASPKSYRQQKSGVESRNGDLDCRALFLSSISS